MTWCIGGNPTDNRWLPDCRHCMSQAEQMAKDYEPPKGHWTFNFYPTSCWGADGWRFDRNCPDCVKAAEALAEDSEGILWVGMSKESFDAKLEEAERKGYVRGHARALESIEIGDNARGLAYDAGVIKGREQGKKLQFFKDRVLLKRHGFSDEGVDGVLGKGIT